MLDKSEKISEDEAKLYDRQIRLWGLEAQKRLHATQVLVSGVKGLGCEVAKNLVLAGVKSLTVIDSEVLTDEDLKYNYLAPKEKLGSNRAEASLDRLQQLNPMVKVSAENMNIANAPESFFDSFDVVVVTGQTKDVLVQINAMCRKKGIKFFCGDIFGFFGFSFVDLDDHEFIEEVLESVEVVNEQARGDEPAAKKSKGEEQVKKVKRNMKFVTLEESLKVDWTIPTYAKRIRRMDPAFFVLQILLEFQSREGRSPQSANEEKDLELLASLRDSVSQKFGLPEDKIPADFVRLLFSELSPVAAIVGGVLSQEIIKVISHKEAPHNNYFLYNPTDSSGIVETIGY